MHDIMEFLKQITANISLDQFNILLLLGIALFGGTIGGKFFQKIRFPQVVGYIIIGILLGQSGLNLVNSNIITMLEPLSYFALALIGFMIGGELKIAAFRKYGKQFLAVLLFEALAAFFVVSFLTGFVTWLIFKDIRLAISLGLLLGAISSATAPAATTDVLWENRSRGPLTTMVLGIVAMDDGLALLLFAGAASAAAAIMGTTSESFWVSILHLFFEIGGAIITGGIFGYALSFLIRKINDEERILAFSLGSILLVIGLALFLKVDMLLAAMTLGFFIANFAPVRSKETFNLVQRFTPPIYVLFFVLVGSRLNIWNVSLLAAVIALVYFLGRTIGKSLGAFLGAKLSRASHNVRKYLALCLFSQAGVAIGLSILAGQKFPGEVGNLIIMIVTTTTFIVQLIGPPFVKLAVIKSGEAGLNISEEDLIKRSNARDILNPHVPHIRENMTYYEILMVFSEHDNLYYPVVNQNQELTGVFSIEIIRNALMVREVDHFLLAHDFMERPPAVCSAETPMLEVEEIMKKYRMEYLPVVDKDKKLIGMIELRGIQKHISGKLLELQQKADSLG